MDFVVYTEVLNISGHSALLAFRAESPRWHRYRSGMSVAPAGRRRSLGHYTIRPACDGSKQTGILRGAVRGPSQPTPLPPGQQTATRADTLPAAAAGQRVMVAYRDGLTAALCPAMVRRWFGGGVTVVQMWSSDGPWAVRRRQCQLAAAAGLPSGPDRLTTCRHWQLPAAGWPRPEVRGDTVSESAVRDERWWQLATTHCPPVCGLPGIVSAGLSACDQYLGTRPPPAAEPVNGWKNVNRPDHRQRRDSDIQRLAGPEWSVQP